MLNGAVVSVDGRIVLATAYGQNPACLCQDLDFGKEHDPIRVVRAARKWEITHVVKDYVDTVREYVPEARFDDYAPEDEVFAVRSRDVLTNRNGLIELCLETHDYHVIHGDTPDAVDIDTYLILKGLQKGTPEHDLVRRNETIRRYIDLGRVLETNVQEEDVEKLCISMQMLEAGLEFNQFFYNMATAAEIEYGPMLFPEDEADFPKFMGVANTFFQKIIEEIRRIGSKPYHNSLVSKLRKTADDFESKVVNPFKQCQTIEDLKTIDLQMVSFFDFEEAKEETELLEMGLDSDWIKTYFDLRGSPDIEVLRRKYLR